MAALAWASLGALSVSCALRPPRLGVHVHVVAAVRARVSWNHGSAVLGFARGTVCELRAPSAASWRVHVAAAVRACELELAVLFSARGGGLGLCWLCFVRGSFES